MPAASEAEDSLVKHETCPMPSAIYHAFRRLDPAHKRDPYGAGLGEPFSLSKARSMFVNAQWALGGEGTGAPVHFHNTAWNALVYGAKKWLIYPPHDR